MKYSSKVLRILGKLGAILMLWLVVFLQLFLIPHAIVWRSFQYFPGYPARPPWSIDWFIAQRIHTLLAAGILTYILVKRRLYAICAAVCVLWLAVSLLELGIAATMPYEWYEWYCYELVGNEIICDVSIMTTNYLVWGILTYILLKRRPLVKWIAMWPLWLLVYYLAVYLLWALFYLEYIDSILIDYWLILPGPTLALLVAGVLTYFIAKRWSRSKGDEQEIQVQAQPEHGVGVADRRDGITLSNRFERAFRAKARPERVRRMLLVGGLLALVVFALIWVAPRGKLDPTVVLRGHEYGVCSVAFSPNARILASGSRDNTIRLWDTANPSADPIVLAGHKSSVEAVAFSPDGQTLASGSWDNTIRLWDVAHPSADPIALTGHKAPALSVAFSPDGQTLASGSYTIRLWDVANPSADPIVLTGHRRYVTSVAFSPDGQTLASGGEDGTIRLWDVANPSADPIVLTAHKDWFGSVAFSPDGQTLASGSGDETTRLWDVANPSADPVVLAGHKDWVMSVAFSPDGQTLASGSEDGTIRLWDVGGE